MDDTGPLDTSRANAARIYDYWLGGKDHFAADRTAGDELEQLFPVARVAAWENRMFHHRAALWMARGGIRQFVDVGCGLPTAENTHQVIRREAPDARVVYADNDPVVISHARALLAHHEEGVVAIQADAREPEALLAEPAVRRMLRRDEPTGLLFTLILHFVPDADDPAGILRRYLDQLSPGSLVAITHVTSEYLDRQEAEKGMAIYAASAHPMYPRTREQGRALLQPMELVPPCHGAEPDLVPPQDWFGPDMPCPEDASRADASTVLWCGVGRKA